MEWIEWNGWRFHETCHGSLYDRNGTVVGGPSPWTLDEAIIDVRDGVVFVRTRDVRPGLWIAGDISRTVVGCDLKANVRSVGSDWSFTIRPTGAGREEFIGHAYRGPFAIQAHAGVRFGGAVPSSPPASIADCSEWATPCA